MSANDPIHVEFKGTSDGFDLKMHVNWIALAAFLKAAVTTVLITMALLAMLKNPEAISKAIELLPMP